MWWTIRAFLLRPVVLGSILALLAGGGGLWWQSHKKAKEKQETADLIAEQKAQIEDLTGKLVQRDKALDFAKEQIEQARKDRIAMAENVKAAQRLAKKHQQKSRAISRQNRKLRERLEEERAKSLQWADSPVPPVVGGLLNDAEGGRKLPTFDFVHGQRAGGD